MALLLLLLMKVRQRCGLGAAVAAIRRRQQMPRLLSAMVLRLQAPLHKGQAKCACAVCGVGVRSSRLAGLVNKLR